MLLSQQALAEVKHVAAQKEKARQRSQDEEDIEDLLYVTFFRERVPQPLGLATEVMSLLQQNKDLIIRYLETE